MAVSLHGKWLGYLFYFSTTCLLWNRTFCTFLKHENYYTYSVIFIVILKCFMHVYMHFIIIIITLQVRTKASSQEECLQELEELLKVRYRCQSGIIYTTSIKDCEQLMHGLRKRNLRVGCYHANLEATLRSKVHAKWLSGEYQVGLYYCYMVTFSLFLLCIILSGILNLNEESQCRHCLLLVAFHYDIK
jgi:hypothetical protein